MPKTFNPDQGSLFEPQHPYPVSYGEPGSYVDVAARAHYLIMALDSISQRNIRHGLSVAAYTEPYSNQIWGSYQEETESVLEGATKNRIYYHNQLRRSFWEATGFAALRGSGLMREGQIEPRAQKMWRDFNHQYGHTSKLKERNRYKRKLGRALEWAMGIKENEVGGGLAA